MRRKQKSGKFLDITFPSTKLSVKLENICVIEICLYTVAQPNLPIVFLTTSGWPEKFFTLCNTVTERQFCENSEYVCRIQIGPQTKATKTFN